MKIKAKDLAEKVNKLRDLFSGEVFDFEYDEAENNYRVETEHYLHACINPDYQLEWLENGTVRIEGNTFYTCCLQDIKPEQE